MLQKTLLILSLFLLNACQQANPTMPNDINITYQSGSVHADRDATTYISIAPSQPNWTYTHGKKFRFISKETGEYKTSNEILKTKTLSKAEVETIFKQLIKHNFYNMKPFYRDAEIMGGSIRSISVQSGKKEKKVSVSNVQQKEFESIVKSIKNIE